MTIDNVVLNSAPLGAFLEGKHGATNNVDSKAKQQGLTSPYFFEGYRDADHPTIAFALAYIGNHGNITPIQTFEFDVLDQLGNLSQRVIMLPQVSPRIRTASSSESNRWMWSFTPAETKSRTRRKTSILKPTPSSISFLS